MLNPLVSHGMRSVFPRACRVVGEGRREEGRGEGRGRGEREERIQKMNISLTWSY